MWRGLAASVVASATAAARLASSLGSQPQECLGPTLRLPRDGRVVEAPRCGHLGLAAHLGLGLAEFKAAALATLLT